MQSPAEPHLVTHLCRHNPQAISKRWKVPGDLDETTMPHRVSARRPCHCRVIRYPPSPPLLQPSVVTELHRGGCELGIHGESCQMIVFNGGRRVWRVAHKPSIHPMPIETLQTTHSKRRLDEVQYLLHGTQGASFYPARFCLLVCCHCVSP